MSYVFRLSNRSSEEGKSSLACRFQSMLVNKLSCVARWKNEYNNSIPSGLSNTSCLPSPPFNIIPSPSPAGYSSVFKTETRAQSLSLLSPWVPLRNPVHFRSAPLWSTCFQNPQQGLPNRPSLLQPYALSRPQRCHYCLQKESWHG